MVLTKNSDFTSKVLIEGLFSLKKYIGETFVIKIGGSMLGDSKKLKSFAQDLVLLKQCGIDVILVHGAGPKVGQILDKLKIKSSFIDNIRISTKDNVDMVEMILSGHINKEVVLEINKAGGTALGFSGKDADLMLASKVRKTHKESDSNIERILDFGFVGVPKKINPDIFQVFAESPVIPVISPVGFGENGDTYNANADQVASAIASAVRASKLILLTEYDGVVDEKQNLIKTLSIFEAESIKKSKTINGNILQKIGFCIEALKGGVSSAHLINIHTEHSILLELLTKDRIGTLIFSNENNFLTEDFDFEDC